MINLDQISDIYICIYMLYSCVVCDYRILTFICVLYASI